VPMPRQLRLQYPGAMYHVMSRGNRREKIFRDDVDRQDFIKTLTEACQKTGWQVHAYCLMPNHYHLVLETPKPNLVAGMAWLQSTYTKARDDADDQSDCGAGEPAEIEGGQRQGAPPHAGRNEPPQSQTTPRWQEDISANE
jgi:REP element-mobilizing transposase RayT